MQHNPGLAPTFSLYDVLMGMGRRKLLLLTCLGLGLMAGMAVVSVSKRVYRAEAQVLIANQATPYDQTNVTQQPVPESAVDYRMMASQIAIIKSEDMASRVISALKLTDVTEFDPLKKGIGTAGRMMIALGFKDDPEPMSPQQRAFRHLESNLNAYSFEDANVIGIKYSAEDGETAAKVANELAETYVLSTQEAQSGSTTRVHDWLAKQIEALRGKVVESEAAVEKFRAERGLIKGQTSTLSAQEISELNSQITVAEAARSEAVARAAAIKEMLQQGTLDASAEVLSSPTIQRMREMQASAYRRVSELEATYLPNHPKMIAAQKDVRDLDAQIRREALKIVESQQNQAKIAAARAASLRKSLEEMKGREGSSLQDEVKLSSLEREAKANRDLLETMLARYADANARRDAALQPGFARIIQVATVPTAHYFPKTGPILALTAFTGLGFGLGLAFLLEIMAQASKLNAGPVQQAAAGSARPPVARSAADQQFPIPGLDVGPIAAPAAQPGRTPGSLPPGFPPAPSAFQPTQQMPVPPMPATGPAPGPTPGAVVSGQAVPPMPGMAPSQPVAPRPAAAPLNQVQVPTQAMPGLNLPNFVTVGPSGAVTGAAAAAPAQPTKFQAPQADAGIPDTLKPATFVPMARSATEAQALLAALASGGSERAQLDRLIENLLLQRQKNNFKVCAISGIGGSYEVAATTVALARALAGMGVKTVLVDTEGQRPLIPDLMGLPHAPGLADLLAGRTDFTKIIQRDQATSLQVVRYGAYDPAQPAGLLAQRMEAVNTALAGIYEIVLLHTGEASPATLGLIKGCKGAILFAHENRQRDAMAAATTLQARGIGEVLIVKVKDPALAVA